MDIPLGKGESYNVRQSAKSCFGATKGPFVNGLGVQREEFQLEGEFFLWIFKTHGVFSGSRGALSEAI